MEHQIYFINAPEINRFKIGRTQNLPARQEQIRGTAPCPVRMVAYANGPAELEAACHDAAEAKGFARRHGEWFEGVLTADDAGRIVQRARARLHRSSPEQRKELYRRAHYAGTSHSSEVPLD